MTVSSLQWQSWTSNTFDSEIDMLTCRIEPMINLPLGPFTNEVYKIEGQRIDVICERHLK